MWNKIKLILKSLKQYKKYAIITPIFMVLEVLFESALPFVMSVFLDLSIQIHDISQFTDVISHPRLPFDVSLLGLIIVF